jgi:endo-1,4-beta-xylanase
VLLSQGTFDFSDCDAVASNMLHTANGTFRGHNFVWGQYNPSWLTQGNFTPSELKAIMETHISMVAKRYAGSFYCWDVVNEAITDNSSASASPLKDMDPWYPALGDSYIDDAFIAAHAADPHARLFYNDYGAEGASSVKAQRVLKMVSGMLGRGVPIHGVGLQMHVSVDYFPDPSDVAANMRALGALGLEVHITEMDVACKQCSASRLQKQAQIYGAMLSACLSVPACKSFETWGFTDLHTWLGTAAQPLPFDAAYAPKPAFQQLLAVLGNR